MAKKKRYYSDGSMMPSGEGKHALMPTESFMRKFPDGEYLNMRPYGDTYEYSDMEANANVRKLRSMPPKRRG